ncbi:MAG TPA: tannase/feruloyl esterase family alpha/beta hydrolase [Candidatus Acidoferrum sp.]|nr:tannase/feruloyl esterase family alpha/beta hydrolase [Candidatus Acidoferrum sp.]
MNRLLVVACLLLTFALVSCVHAAGRTCEQLAQLALPNTQISSAKLVAAGAFAPPEVAEPWMRADASFYKQLPAFCRVLALAKPTADSDIKIEVWLPATGWNGKFRGQGNGGFAGSIDYRALGWAIAQGYATAATDTGHAADSSDAVWALNHPEKIIDFAHRAIHEMTIFGKATTNAFYGEAPKKSYFANCSNGGRQALMEAQRYPDDYDGILAGAPANYFTHLLASALWDAQATTNDQASYIPSSKITAIAQAVVAACDANDGVKDGIVNDPRQCHFDPATMLCKGGNSDSCLTQPQVTALKKLYQGPYGSTGKQIFPGLQPGGELGQSGWLLWITGPAPEKALVFAFDHGYFADMVYSQADWDYRHANLDDAVKASDEKFANVLNATQTDMQAYADRGGKLIIYHGWSDAAISPLNSINYYQSVIEKMGQAQTDSFVRLYMVPGMQHCGDGPGPNEFGAYGESQVNDPQHNMYLALEQWVEKGIAPPTFTASKMEGEGPAAKVTMTRPLCPYPQQANYKGTGDTNDAKNFSCAPEK